jgi:hypothetical protein
MITVMSKKHHTFPIWCQPLNISCDLTNRASFQVVEAGIEGDELSLAGQANKTLLSKLESKIPYD